MLQSMTTEVVSHDAVDTAISGLWNDFELCSRLSRSFGIEKSVIAGLRRKRESSMW
jgi:hypothetical protein